MIAITVTKLNEDRTRLADEFPMWHIWNSRAGRWWATRRGNARLTRELDPGWSMTVDADTPDELRLSIQEQEGLG